LLQAAAAAAAAAALTEGLLGVIKYVRNRLSVLKYEKRAPCIKKEVAKFQHQEANQMKKQYSKTVLISSNTPNIFHGPFERLLACASVGLHACVDDGV